MNSFDYWLATMQVKDLKECTVTAWTVVILYKKFLMQSFVSYVQQQYLLHCKGASRLYDNSKVDLN